MKTTVVIGASPNPERYSFKAVTKLRKHDHNVIAIGVRNGTIADVEILLGQPKISEDIDTITLYIGPARQVAEYDYILNLYPKRIIFNPGTENEEFKNLAKEKKIEVVEDCTLVMLRKGNY